MADADDLTPTNSTSSPNHSPSTGASGRVDTLDDMSQDLVCSLVNVPPHATPTAAHQGGHNHGGYIMMRKPLVGVAICAAAILGVSGSAFAGEVTGNGNAKAVKANSECAFSGLEDWATEGEQPPGEVFVVPGVTQNWGQIPKEDRDFLRSIGVSPEELCNGQKNPLHGD